MIKLHVFYAILLAFLLTWRFYRLHRNYSPDVFPPLLLGVSMVLAIPAAAGVLRSMASSVEGPYWIPLTNGDIPSIIFFWICTIAYAIWSSVLLFHSKGWKWFLDDANLDSAGIILSVALGIISMCTVLGYCASSTVMAILMGIQ